MLALELLDGPRNLTFMTRKGTQITYGRGVVLTPAGARQARMIEDEYPGRVERKALTGRYNCHGLTFANRRGHFNLTKAEWDTIIGDDEYHQVGPDEVRVGDMIAYFEFLGVSHTGIVLKVESGANQVRQIMDLSKWGNAGEFVHEQYDCPYAKGAEIRYYREGKSDGKLAES